MTAKLLVHLAHFTCEYNLLIASPVGGRLRLEAIASPVAARLRLEAIASPVGGTDVVAIVLDPVGRRGYRVPRTEKWFP